MLVLGRRGISLGIRGLLCRIELRLGPGCMTSLLEFDTVISFLTCELYFNVKK